MCCVHKQKMYDKCTWNEPEHVVLEPFVFALSNIKYRERKNRGLVHDAIGKRITNFEKPILQWWKRMKNARFFDGDLHEKTVKRFNCFQKKKNHFTTSALNERRETLCDQRLFCISTRVCVCVWFYVILPDSADKALLKTIYDDFCLWWKFVSSPRLPSIASRFRDNATADGGGTVRRSVSIQLFNPLLCAPLPIRRHRRCR